MKRYMLGNQEEYVTLGLEDCSTFRIKYRTSVLARYCTFCGAESLGAAIYAEEGFTNSELRERFDQEDREKRRKALAESRSDSKNMLDLIFRSPCPLCGKPFMENAPKGFFWFEDEFSIRNADGFGTFMSGIDELFQKMDETRKVYYEKTAQDAVKEFTEMENDKHHFSDALVSRTAEITGSKETLLPYIGHLMRLEVGLYSTERNLEELYKGKAELKESILKKYHAEIEETDSTIVNLKDQVDSFVEEHDSFVFVPEQEITYPAKPKKPKSPILGCVPPEEPVYQVAGLFNKKKITAENNAKKQEYEQQMEKYQQRQNAYKAECEIYDAAIAQYEKDEAAWNAKVDDLNQKVELEYKNAVIKKEAEYNKKLTELNNTLEEAEAKQKQYIDYVALGKALDNQAGMELLAAEILEGEKLLESIIATRNELYSYNVIYPKYRNLVALSSFYDYLMSGRCDALVGTNGAYNLYETESRTDLIITQLSDVLASLDKIQNNQFILYQQMSDVNNGVKALNDSMKSAISSLANLEITGVEMKSYLKNIQHDAANTSKDVKTIADNSKIIAHYSKVNAIYAKRNAELTDALGYMVAFK